MTSNAFEILLSSMIVRRRGNSFRPRTTLSEEQFHRRFEMGPGSLHDTLATTCWRPSVPGATCWRAGKNTRAWKA